MFNDNKLRKKILLFTVIPSLLAGICLIASFMALYNSQVQSLEREKFELVERIIAAHPPAPLSSEPLNSLEFEHLASMLLAIKPLHSVSVFDSNQNLVLVKGLPGPERSALNERLFRRNAHQWHDGTTTYRMIPLEANAGWVLVEMDGAGFSVLRQRGVITLLLIATALMAVIAYCATQLRNIMTKPLRQLEAGVASYLAGDVTQPIVTEKGMGFQQLAEAMGQLAKKQQLEQDSMQSDLEEYTRELRETLETVEVQNIELDMARKNALQSSRAKSEFLANASHELRTPLNGIIGFANLLLKTELSDQQTDYLTTIEHSAQGLLTIINDVLDISRLETGELILEYKPVSVYQVIEDALKIHAPGAHEKKLRLVTLIDPHVPQNLLGDPLRLKQVVTNLLSNAIKFSDQGTIVIRVNFIGETDNQIHAKFSVSDSGIGLTREQQERLFKSFTQVDAADNRLRGGTGLGLAIARGLVQRMRGEIGVDSEPGKGSTFWFTARFGLNNDRTTTQDHTKSLSGTRLLIFDSNTTGRSEVVHLMNNWGADYLETGDFDRICELVRANSSEAPIQLAILDAQIDQQRFDKQRLCATVEKLNNEFQLPVVVLAPPNICRILDPLLSKLQVVLMNRPLAQHQLHRILCGHLGVTGAAVTKTPEIDQKPPCGDKPVRILAVDDNPANLRLVTELLKGLGAQTEMALSGAAALDICSSSDFDLILMDIQMPEMDGLETTRRLREQEETGKRTPIIALTAHAVDEQKTRLLLAGMDDYVGKPVSENELRHVIERWANRGKPEINGTPEDSAINTEPEPLSESAESESELAIFDPALALELAKQKTDLARDMFVMLLESLGDTAAAVTEAAHDEDMTRLQNIVHKLYGGCCYCGVPALRQASGDLHSRLHRQQFTGIGDAVALLLTRIHELLQWTSERDMEMLFAEAEEF